MLALQHLRALAEIAALDKSLGAVLNLSQGLAPTAAVIEEGLEDTSAAALQRTAVAEANAQKLTSQVATLNAQVENLQAALQAATEALKSTQTESKSDASAPTAATIEEGLEDALSLNHHEISCLAEVIDRMMKLKRNRIGYLV